MVKAFNRNIPGWVALVLSALFLHATASAHAKDREAPSALRSQIEAVIGKVKPALVRIRVVSTEYSEGREVKQQAVGSGAIITRDGYLITNHHVAGHASRMFCTLWNREEIEAELVGTDAMTDISILKLKPEKPREFAYVSFGDSTLMRVGDYVLAMGSPMALSQSVTLGIVSNTEMVMPRFWGSQSRFRLDGEDVGSLVKWIAHDAAIYGGNSGGPLVSLKGEIIGINEISFGLSGAIPGNLARRVADTIMAKGKVQRSWLGIDVQPLFKHTKDEHGLVVSGVMEDSPADKAGLAAADVLLRLNGTPTDVRFDEQLPDVMGRFAALPIGKEATLLVRRGDKELTLHLTPIERGDLYPRQREIKPWGLTARNFSALLAREMKRPDLSGVLVTTVRPGGPSGEAKPALEPRDVIVEVGGVAVKDLEDLLEQTRKLTEGKTEPVPTVVVFERKGARYLAVVRVGLQELKDPGLEVTKAWLPVETHVISREIAKQLGKPGLKGFYITRVYAKSSAEKAGLKVGDFLTGLDGEKLTASGPEHEDELETLVRQYDVGKTVELAVLRTGQPRKVNVELMRSPRQRREMKKYSNEDFEFTARDVSFFDSAEEQWDDAQRGALVEEVKTGSWAELAGLYSGDLILEVDGAPISNVEALHRKMDEIAARKTRLVVVKVLRGIHTSYLEMEPDWK